MTNTDKIRNWILERKEAEEIRPGDKLPCYKEFMEMFGISYLTASNTLNRLAREGIVECKRGSGTYLAGASNLKVLLNMHATTIPFDTMRKLLNKHLANADLHLEIECAPEEEINNPLRRDEVARTCKAAISIHPIARVEQELPAAALTQMPDYEAVMADLVRVDDTSYEYALPFTFCSHQLGVNRELLARTGLRVEELTPGFGWWNDFAARCRKHRLLPASFEYVETSSLFFQSFLPLLYSLVPYDKRKYEGDEPLFQTPVGHLLLDVIRDSQPITDIFNDPRSFFHNGAVLHPQLGSWITVQNGRLERPDKEVSDLVIVPYRTPDGRKLHFLDPDCLKAYLRHDVTIDERNRVWELMKIMVSREFQIDYCGLSGLISANRGLLPTEYYWNRTNEWADFFPGPDACVAYGRTRFTPAQRAMLSVLLENFKFFGAPAEETLYRMDRKKRFYRIESEKSRVYNLK